MGVEFHEEKEMRRMSSQGGGNKSGGALSQLVIKLGLAKDQVGAGRVLLVILIITVAATAYTLFG